MGRPWRDEASMVAPHHRSQGSRESYLFIKEQVANCIHLIAPWQCQMGSRAPSQQTPFTKSRKLGAKVCGFLGPRERCMDAREKAAEECYSGSTRQTAGSRAARARWNSKEAK